MSTEINMKGWSDAERAAHAEALEEAQQEEAARDLRISEDASRRTSAAALIEELAERAAVAKEEREEAERTALGDAELAKAKKKHGRDKVSLIPTLRGPIVLRAATAKELDEHETRVEALDDRPLDRTKAWREFTADLVVFPKREEFVAIMDEFGGTWSIVAAVRDALATATRSAVAKKG